MGAGTCPLSTSSRSCWVQLWISHLSVSPTLKEAKFHLITLSPVTLCPKRILIACATISDHLVA